MHRKIAALTLAGVLVLAACGDGDSSSDTSVPAESTTSTIASTELVDADNVLLAVALFEVGDIDAALAEGLVNPDEVDAAAQAVDDGTLDGWIELADGR